MNNLLAITCSLFGDKGKSTQLVEFFIKTLCAANESWEVTKRDLAPDKIPHLTEKDFNNFISKSSTVLASSRLSEDLINEIKCADIIVIGMPLYNLSTPSAFKSYVDHIVRAGLTFQYTEKGPQGLLKSKPVYFCMTRGGCYLGSSLETQTEYLKHIMALIGLSDTYFIYAEGLNIDQSSAESALNAARDNITKSVEDILRYQVKKIS